MSNQRKRNVKDYIHFTSEKIWKSKFYLNDNMKYIFEYI